MLEHQLGDAEVIVDTATRATEPHPVNPDELYAIVTPEGGTLQVLELERHLPTPNRKRGTTIHHTGPSLASYVAAHAVAGTALYADVEAHTVVAVINGHEAAPGVAGWGDHRAVLTLRTTPAWDRWRGRDGKIGSQTDFAEHLEDGAGEIVDPPAAEMLELASTFQAAVKVNFRQATVLPSGQRQLTFEETIEANAGARGQIIIPPRFTLGIAPFEGTDPYRLEARLRFRLREGALTIGYILDRPDDVLRAAFGDVLASIENITLHTAYHGRPTPA